jgi:hypothetical protein
MMAGLLDAAVTEVRKKPGGSNVGKYPNVESFCGPSGGAPNQPLNWHTMHPILLAYATVYTRSTHP